jgi:hypothetical protein
VRPQWLLRLSPALSTIGLLLIVVTVISQLFEHMKSVTPTDASFLWWAIGKYAFAFFTFCTLVLLVLRWKFIKADG